MSQIVMKEREKECYIDIEETIIKDLLFPEKKKIQVKNNKTTHDLKRILTNKLELNYANQHEYLIHISKLKLIPPLRNMGVY